MPLLYCLVILFLLTVLYLLVRKSILFSSVVYTVDFQTSPDISLLIQRSRVYPLTDFTSLISAAWFLELPWSAATQRRGDAITLYNSDESLAY